VKIIYIAGDGRSGSTLLDSILSNIDGSLSVGECHRFWNRFYEGETLCSCGNKITDCELWNKVDKQLKARFVDYNPNEFKARVIEIQKYKNFDKIPHIVSSEAWKPFCEQVIAYYKIIAVYNKRGAIIDSSKSISWCYFLEQLNFSELYIIHLERNLSSVANSWKKHILLPEYDQKEVLMPIKSIALSTKIWLKVKLMARRLKKAEHYLFISYEGLCKNPEHSLRKIKAFVDEDFDNKNLKMQPTHAIGGNPMRAHSNHNISIVSHKDINKNLNKFEHISLKFVNQLANIFI